MDFFMNIGKISMSMAQINTQSQVGIAVTDKVLDQQKQTGDAMIKMMEQSVNPGIGSTSDIRV